MKSRLVSCAARLHARRLRARRVRAAPPPAARAVARG
jgi:hypothetical protein